MVKRYQQFHLEAHPKPANITGANQTLSLEATFEPALKLFSQATQIKAMVCDKEANGRINLEHYRAVAKGVMIASSW